MTGNRYFIKNVGLLKASGKDVIDFLNRMSTNDFRKFSPGEFRKTVLTTDKGRIIDLINVLNLPDNPLILTSENFEDKIISHLEKYIILDDVMLKKNGMEFVNFILTGENIISLARDILGLELVKDKIYKLSDNEFIFLDDFRFDSVNIICQVNSIEKYKDILKNFTEQAAEEYEDIRINAGLPQGENEFNEQINPMECGLDKYISFTKGCYIGQEVIARLDSQGKRPKQIVKIKSESEIDVGDKIYTLDKEAGFISSKINLNGISSALGFIRSISLDFEKDYTVLHNDGKNKIEILKIN